MCLALVLLMADVLDAVERVILPLPPPLQGALVAGPYNFQFTGEDALRLTVTNSLAGVRVRVAYRTAPTPTQTQSNEHEIAPTSDRLATTTEFSVGAGYLLNLTVFVSSGAPAIGQTYVQVQVIRGRGASARVLGDVVGGYITARQARAWPGSAIEDSISGGGYIRPITGTTPAAGSDLLEQVPTGARWQLLQVTATFQSSVAAANRRPTFWVSTGGTNRMVVPNPAVIAANTTIPFMLGEGYPVMDVGPGSYSVLPIPMSLYLLAADTWFSFTLNVQAGDQWSAVRYTVREWLEVN